MAASDSNNSRSSLSSRGAALAAVIAGGAVVVAVGVQVGAFQFDPQAIIDSLSGQRQGNNSSVFVYEDDSDVTGSGLEDEARPDSATVHELAGLQSDVLLDGSLIDANGTMTVAGASVAVAGEGGAGNGGAAIQEPGANDNGGNSGTTPGGSGNSGYSQGGGSGSSAQLPNNLYFGLDYGAYPKDEGANAGKHYDSTNVEIDFKSETGAKSYASDKYDTLGVKSLYQGMDLDAGKLLEAGYFYVAIDSDNLVKRTGYRLQEFDSNFQVGAFPSKLEPGTTSITVPFRFRANADSDWIETTVDFPVHKSAVEITDADGNVVKTAYLDEGEKLDLTKLYGWALSSNVRFDYNVTSGGQHSVGLDTMVTGFAPVDEKDTPATDSGFEPQGYGYHKIGPVQLEKVPDGFSVDLVATGTWNINYTGWEATDYAQVLTGYYGSDSTVNIPNGIQKVTSNALSPVVTADVIVLPASIRDVPAGTLVAKRAFEIADANANADAMVYTLDGNLYQRSVDVDGFLTGKSSIVGVPVDTTDLTVGPEVDKVTLPGGSKLQTVHFSGDPLALSMTGLSELRGVDVVVDPASYIDYYVAWGANPGDASNSLVTSDGQTPDYVIDGNFILSGDRKTLVRALPSSADIVMVPEGVETIAADALSSLTGVKAVVLPASVTDNQAAGNPEHTQGVERVVTNGSEVTVEKINGFSVMIEPHEDGTADVTVVSAPSGITEFRGDELGDVRPTAIAAGAFEGCESLRKVLLPESVKSVGARAFADCPSLELFYAQSPDTLSLGGSVLAGDSGLRAAVSLAPNATVDADDNIFGSDNLKRLLVPVGATGYHWSNEYNYGTYARYSATSERCNEYELVETADGEFVLYGENTDGREDVTQGLRVVTASKFLTGNVTLGEGLTKLDATDGVVLIDEGAFEGAKSFSLNPESMASVQFVLKNAFKDSGISGELNMPKLDYVGESGFQNTAITGVLDQESLTELDVSAFRNTGIMGVNAPNLSYIGSYCFQESDVSGDLVLGSGLRTIGSSAFLNCTGLTSVTIASDAPLTTINPRIFANTGLTRLVLPDSVTNITESAFIGIPNLVTVEIPSSVSAIGTNVFSQSGVTEIMFAGTVPPELRSRTLEYSGESFSFTGNDSNLRVVLADSSEDVANAFIAKWKRPLIGKVATAELTEVEDVRGQNAVRQLLGLELLPVPEDSGTGTGTGGGVTPGLDDGGGVSRDPGGASRDPGGATRDPQPGSGLGEGGATRDPGGATRDPGSGLGGGVSRDPQPGSGLDEGGATRDPGSGLDSGGVSRDPGSALGGGVSRDPQPGSGLDSGGVSRDPGSGLGGGVSREPQPGTGSDSGLGGGVSREPGGVSREPGGVSREPSSGLDAGGVSREPSSGLGGGVSRDSGSGLDAGGVSREP